MIDLLPHQIKTVDWLLWTKRCLLADDKGVGKTHPTIWASLLVPGPRLFVVPGYLQYEWLKAIYEVQPDANVTYVRGTSEYRAEAIKSGILEDDIILMSYEQLRIHAEMLLETNWGVFVADEAHKFRGRNSKQTLTATKLKKEFVFLVTATPQMRDVGDWYALLRILYPKRYTSYYDFVAHWAEIIDNPWGMYVGKPRNVPEFREMIRPLILRRKFKDVGIELPPNLRKEIHILAPRAFYDEYRSIKRTYRQQQENGVRYFTSAGAMMSALYQLTAAQDDKFDALLELVYDRPKENIIIWCWRRGTAEMISAALHNRYNNDKHNRGHYMHSGQVQPNIRAQNLQKFKTTQGAILVATIASLSLGANLQVASTSIFYEQSYLPDENEQANARMLRLGQLQETETIILLLDNTVDTRVHKVCKQRSTNESVIMDDLLGDDDDDS